MSTEPGILYVVATPLGNLGDMTIRARKVLSEVSLIAAEDTRVTQRLLNHLGLKARCLSLHEHNEEQRIPTIMGLLAEGKSVALVSDAGTPLISDPGYSLVRTLREAGYRVSPVPGPSAVIAALSVSGLPTNRFIFEGFLPAKTLKRQTRLEGLAGESATLVFYESSHRIVNSLTDMSRVFGSMRHAVIARELTKRFEQVASAPLGELVIWVKDDANRQKGEFVIMIEGVPGTEKHNDITVSEHRIVEVLAAELPTRQAADLAARMTGGARQHLYRAIQREKQKTPNVEGDQT